MARKSKDVNKIDTVAGSRSYNRTDMQVSHTLHMALELYDELNFLLILDHYDDITLLDLDTEPLVVCYYQMKTSDDRITLDIAIKENWISKLYVHLNKPNDWIIKELGLITNCPLTVSCVKKDSGKRKEKRLSAEKTSFSQLDEIVQEKIKADIANKFQIDPDHVDLSALAHIRTTLSIERHRDIVEKETSDFLFQRYPRISLDIVKGLFNSLINLLVKKQEYEILSEDAPFEDVKGSKGFDKTEMNRLINQSIMISVPDFETVLKYAQVDKDTERIVGWGYARIISDSVKAEKGTFPKLSESVLNTIRNHPYDPSETSWIYSLKIERLVQEKDSFLCTPYNDNYIAVLVLCLMINLIKGGEM